MTKANKLTVHLNNSFPVVEAARRLGCLKCVLGFLNTEMIFFFSHSWLIWQNWASLAQNSVECIFQYSIEWCLDPGIHQLPLVGCFASVKLMAVHLQTCTCLIRWCCSNLRKCWHILIHFSCPWPAIFHYWNTNSLQIPSEFHILKNTNKKVGNIIIFTA